MDHTQFTLAQLRQWIVDQIGVAEVTRVRVPPDAGLGTEGFFTGPPPDKGTMSGSEQLWANIVTRAGTEPNNSGAVECKVIPWGGGTESDWMDPADVPAYVASKTKGA